MQNTPLAICHSIFLDKNMTPTFIRLDETIGGQIYHKYVPLSEVVLFVLQSYPRPDRVIGKWLSVEYAGKKYDVGEIDYRLDEADAIKKAIKTLSI